MIPKPFWVSLAFLSLAISTTTTGPQVPAETMRAPQGKRRALVQKAFSLLDELLGEVQTLKLPENRVRVQAIAADLLREHDPERARALFVEAGQQLGERKISLAIFSNAFISLEVPVCLRPSHARPPVQNTALISIRQAKVWVGKHDFLLAPVCGRARSGPWAYREARWSALKILRAWLLKSRIC